MGILKSWGALRYWQKGVVMALGLSVLLYLFKLFRVLYKDWVFSGLDASKGFAYLYDLPSLKEALMVVVFLGAIFGFVGIIREIKGLSRSRKGFRREIRL